MWQIHAMQAFELVREREREAAAARLARAAAGSRPGARRPPIRRQVVSGGRRLAVGALRRLGAGAGSIADAACAAATRLDRGPA